MFDGLYLFEWVLMALGVILFVVLVIGFFYQAHAQQAASAFCMGFFLVPIAMIGYPSLQSIQISDNKVSLEKKADAVLSKSGRHHGQQRTAATGGKAAEPAVFRSRRR